MAIDVIRGAKYDSDGRAPRFIGIWRAGNVRANGVPLAYADAWARLQCHKPMAVSAEEWRRAIDAAGRFLDAWGAFAVEFQWTPGELFDVPRHGERCGLIWFLGGETVRALGPAHAITESGRNFLREDDFDAGLLQEGAIK